MKHYIYSSRVDQSILPTHWSLSNVQKVTNIPHLVVTWDIRSSKQTTNQELQSLRMLSSKPQSQIVSWIKISIVVLLEMMERKKYGSLEKWSTMTKILGIWEPDDKIQFNFT